MGALIGTLALPARVYSAFEPLYPPIDLTYFDTPISAGPSQIHFGYAAITWNGNDRQAIEDISSLSFPGIQLRANVVDEFPNPNELRDLLQQHRLKMVALSSGGIGVESSDEAGAISKHLRNVKYVHDLGGLYLQVTDQKPKGRAVTPNDYKRLGSLLTEIGKRSADLGVQLGYHNHMGSMGEHPDEVNHILQLSDPRYVKLELDIAHYVQGGGDPAKAIEQCRDRLLFLHLKDVESVSDGTKHRDFRFVELGRGRVNLPAVFDALKRVGFRGWAIIELDGEMDGLRTPKESAVISKNYLQQLGFSI
jgi:inosose dehydratase